jgi:hypothetical protein
MKTVPVVSQTTVGLTTIELSELKSFHRCCLGIHFRKLSEGVFLQKRENKRTSPKASRVSLHLLQRPYHIGTFAEAQVARRITRLDDFQEFIDKVAIKHFT